MCGDKEDGRPSKGGGVVRAGMGGVGQGKCLGWLSAEDKNKFLEN